MALTLSKTGIVDGQVITAAQITQSIDALTAAAAYDISISGSFSLIGNMTGSGIFARASVADQIRPVNQAANQDFTLPYLAATSSTTFIYYSALGPTYNPVSDTIRATNFNGTASFCASSSLAQTASYVNPSSFLPSRLAPSYFYVDGTTYPTGSPFPIGSNTPTNLYVSSSAANVIGLQFVSANDGQIINFNPFWEFTTMTTNTIAITASVFVFGLGGGTNVVQPGTPKTLDLILPTIPTLRSFTFQYIATPGVSFPAPGWYLINVNNS